MHPQLEYEVFDNHGNGSGIPAPCKSYGSFVALTVAVDVPRHQCRRYPIGQSTTLQLEGDARVVGATPM
jgi:hypothetical protein